MRKGKVFQKNGNYLIIQDSEKEKLNQDILVFCKKIIYHLHTVSPRSLDQIYVVTSYIKWSKTSWTDSLSHSTPKVKTTLS